MHPKDTDWLLDLRKLLCKAGTDELDLEKAFGAAVHILRETTDPHLNVSSLQRITISWDYDEAVAIVSKELGIAARATTRSGGVGMAMVLQGADFDALVIHAGLIDRLFSAASELRDLAWHTLHHELLHVHDNHRKRPLLRRCSVAIDDHAVFAATDLLWSEYFAERRSHATYNRSDVLFLPMLVDAIQGGSQGPRDLLFVLKTSGHVLGVLHGAGRTLAEADANAAAVVAGSLLGVAWETLGRELAKLFDTQSSWPSMAVYDPLLPPVRRLFERSNCDVTSPQ